MQAVAHPRTSSEVGSDKRSVEKELSTRVSAEVQGEVTSGSCVDDDIDQGSSPLGMESHVYEIGADELSEPISVKGRLRAKFAFWKDVLHASPSILSVIESGYVLPLMSEPTPFSGRNQVSALQNAEFVDQCVEELLGGSCIKEQGKAPYICSPLSVVESNSGKKRLVINLRHLNRFLLKQKLKYEDLRVAMLLFQRGDYMFSFDLKSGYHHVDSAEKHHKYLGFLWKDKYYVFTVLPFGLCTACYLFTKLMRPVVRYWRGQGLRVVVYLDDGLCAVNGIGAADAASQLVRHTLDQAGFAVHPGKSVWKPTQRLAWLGFVTDMSLGQIEVPESKIAEIRGMLEFAKQSDQVRAKFLASTSRQDYVYEPCIRACESVYDP